MALVALAPLPGALLGAALFVGGVLLRPSLVVPAIVLTLPLYLQPRNLGGQEISVAEAAILLGCTAAAAQSFWIAHWGRRDAARAVGLPQPRGVDWAAAAFIIGALLSLVVTEYPKQSLRELRWLVVEPILVFYLARATLSSSGQVAGVLWSVVAAGAMAAAIGMLDLLAAGRLMDVQARATAPYLSPNHLGLFLGRAGAVALAIALLDRAPRRQRGWGRWSAPGAWLAIDVIGLGLIRTLSVGAWIGTAAAALVLGAIRGRRTVQVMASGLLAVALLAVVTLPPERTLDRLDPALGTGLLRIYVWQSAGQMIADHPLLGIGLDNFLYAYRDRYMAPEAWREPNLSHPHNWVLHFWLETGLIGLAAALALMIWTGLTAFRLLRSSQAPVDRCLAGAAAAVIADFVVHGSFDNAYFLVDLAVLWWIFVALLAIRTSPSGAPGWVH